MLANCTILVKTCYFAFGKISPNCSKILLAASKFAYTMVTFLEIFFRPKLTHWKVVIFPKNRPFTSKAHSETTLEGGKHPSKVIYRETFENTPKNPSL